MGTECDNNTPIGTGNFFGSKPGIVCMTDVDGIEVLIELED